MSPATLAAIERYTDEVVAAAPHPRELPPEKVAQLRSLLAPALRTTGRRVA